MRPALSRSRRALAKGSSFSGPSFMEECKGLGFRVLPPWKSGVGLVHVVFSRNSKGPEVRESPKSDAQKL